jgi:hypothetical protein
MWRVERECCDRETEKVRIASSGRVLSFADVIAGWAGSEEFRAFFIGALAATAHPAFFWEMPPIRRGALERPYEYVTVASNALARLDADDDAFALKLRAAQTSVVSFRNLGGDAVLVVPRREGETKAYAHIAAFVRAGPAAQQHVLLRALAQSIEDALENSSDPVWVSTSGLGVPWVHVRLDSFPKYYQHEPYTQADDR